MGGEYWCARLADVELLEFAVADDHPAARKPGRFRTELLTLISRSPMPSLIVERYDERNCQIVKLGGVSGVIGEMRQSQDQSGLALRYEGETFSRPLETRILRAVDGDRD